MGSTLGKDWTRFISKNINQFFVRSYFLKREIDFWVARIHFFCQSPFTWTFSNNLFCHFFEINLFWSETFLVIRYFFSQWYHLAPQWRVQVEDCSPEFYYFYQDIFSEGILFKWKTFWITFKHFLNAVILKKQHRM